MHGFDAFTGTNNQQQQQQQQQQLDMIRALQSAMKDGTDNNSASDSSSSGAGNSSSHSNYNPPPPSLPPMQHNSSSQNFRDREREIMRANVLADIQRNPLEYFGGGSASGSSSSGIGAFGPPLGGASGAGGGRGGPPRSNPMFDLCRQLPTPQELNSIGSSFESNPMFSIPFLKNMQRKINSNNNNNNNNNNNINNNNNNNNNNGAGSSSSRHNNDIFASLLNSGNSSGASSSNSNSRNTFQPPRSPGMPSPHIDALSNSGSNSVGAGMGAGLFNAQGTSPLLGPSSGARGMPPPLSFSDLDFPQLNNNSNDDNINNKNNNNASRNNFSFRMNNNNNNNSMDSPQFGGSGNGGGVRNEPVPDSRNSFNPFSLAPSSSSPSSLSGGGRSYHHQFNAEHQFRDHHHHQQQQQHQIHRRTSGGGDHEFEYPCGRPANRPTTTTGPGLNWNGPSPLLSSQPSHINPRAPFDENRIPIHGPNYPFGPPFHNPLHTSNNAGNSSSRGGGGGGGPFNHLSSATSASASLPSLNSPSQSRGVTMKRSAPDVSTAFNNNINNEFNNNENNSYRTFLSQNNNNNNSNQSNRNSNNSYTSRYRGVSWKKDRSAWAASIMVEGRHEHVGYFDNEMEAAMEWDKRARQVRGPDAQLNFPPHKFDNNNSNQRGGGSRNADAAIAAALSAAVAASSGAGRYSRDSVNNNQQQHVDLLNPHSLMEMARGIAADVNYGGNGDMNNDSIVTVLNHIRQLTSNNNNSHDGGLSTDHMTQQQQRMLAAAISAANMNRNNDNNMNNNNNNIGPGVKRRKSGGGDVAINSITGGNTSRHVKAKAARTSNFRGVIWDKNSRAWRAKLSVHGKLEHIGLFDVEEEAAKAWDLRAMAVRGARARCNFPAWAGGVHERGEHEKYVFTSQRIRGVSTATPFSVAKAKKKAMAEHLRLSLVEEQKKEKKNETVEKLPNKKMKRSKSPKATKSSSSSSSSSFASSSFSSLSTVASSSTFDSKRSAAPLLESSPINSTTTHSAASAPVAPANNDENFAAAASLLMVRRGANGNSNAGAGAGAGLVAAMPRGLQASVAMATKTGLASPAVVPTNSSVTVNVKPPRIHPSDKRNSLSHESENLPKLCQTTI